MKIFGYQTSTNPDEVSESSELAEITVTATPDELRRIATFLTRVADEMAGWTDATYHRHLSDLDKSFESSPHFVVYLPR